MKRLLFVFLLILVNNLTQGQNLFFKTGLNHTTYNFKDQNGIKLQGLIPGVAPSYQLGAGFPIFQEWGNYEIGVTIDSFDATGGGSNDNFHWNTTYGGIRNSVEFYPIWGDLTLGIKANLGTSKIINGSQSLNNAKFDISRHPEFNGILLQPGLGLTISYRVFEQGSLSFQYDYSNSTTLGKKTMETLNFQNNRILFGIHYQLY
jgi:hypothetical protein